MAGTISRMLIILAAMLLPFSVASAKSSLCQRLLFPGETPGAETDYLVGNIDIAFDEAGKASGKLTANPGRVGRPDASAGNIHLWLVRGTSNLNSLPREKELLVDGQVEIAFPFEVAGGRTFKIVFRYSQVNRDSALMGVLDKIEILDDYGYKVKVKPDQEGHDDLEAMVWKIGHGPQRQIFGLSVADTIIPFKSHIQPEELSQLKDFFTKFFEYPTNLRGRTRNLLDLHSIETTGQLEAKAIALKTDNTLQWWKGRGQRIAAQVIITGAVIYGYSFALEKWNPPPKFSAETSLPAKPVPVPGPGKQ